MNGTVRTGRGRGAADPAKLPSARSPGSTDKHKRILAAAREVFIQHGFQAASMDLVAAVAGVSKVTIYSKFGSKQELFSAIVDDICEQILAMEIVLPGAVESSYEGLTELAIRYALVLYDPEVLALVRLAIGENHDEKLLGRLYYQAGPARARAGARPPPAGHVGFRRPGHRRPRAGGGPIRRPAAATPLLRTA